MMYVIVSSHQLILSRNISYIRVRFEDALFVVGMGGPTDVKLV